MKKYRLIALIGMLTAMLTLTGCFGGNPGLDLVGTWVADMSTIEPSGPQQLIIQVVEQPFHRSFVLGHAYAYNAIITYGEAVWTIPIPSETDREALFDQLWGVINGGEIAAPDFPVFGWAALVNPLGGAVLMNYTGVFYPLDDTHPVLFMHGDFTATDGFTLNVGVNEKSWENLRFVKALN